MLYSWGNVEIEENAEQNSYRQYASSGNREIIGFRSSKSRWKEQSRISSS